MRVVRKALVIGCIVMAFGCVLLLAVPSQYYYSTRPREPHPEDGRVYPECVKGTTGVADVYLTRIEHLPFEYQIWIQSGSMLSALAAFLLNERWKILATPTYRRPKKFY